MIKYIGISLLNLPIQPLIKPIIPQAMICHIVHIPIPNSIFDKNVTNMANKIAEKGPKNIPQIIIIDVTGWTFGKNVNTYLPITPSAANIEINVIRYTFI